MSHAESKSAEENAFPIYSFFGHRSDFSLYEVRTCVLQLGFPLFLGLAVGILVLFDAHGYVTDIGFWPATFVWSSFVVVVAAFYLLTLSALLLLKPYFPKLFIYLPFIGIFAMTVTTFATTYQVVYFVGSGDTYAQSLAILPFNFVLGVFFETIFFVFVKPVLARTIVEPKIKYKSTPREIEVSGHSFQVEKIRYLRAQDHYVDAHLDGEKTMIRARLRDFISQLDPDEGVMPHRSYWVSWREILQLELSSNQPVVTLIGGERIPIAKSRVADVEHEAGARNIPTVRR